MECAREDLNSREKNDDKFKKIMRDKASSMTKRIRIVKAVFLSNSTV